MSKKHGYYFLLSMILVSYLIGCRQFFPDPTLDKQWESLTSAQKNRVSTVEHFFVLAMANHNLLAYELASDDKHDEIDEWFVKSDAFDVRKPTVLVVNTSYTIFLGPLAFTVEDMLIQMDENGYNKVVDWDSLSWE